MILRSRLPVLLLLLLLLCICNLSLAKPSRRQLRPRQLDETTYTKLFVATGASASSFSDPTPELLADVEIVDLVELDHPCTKPRDFPEPMTGAVGAFVDGAPVICGGYYEDGSDRCYRYDQTNDEWEDPGYAMNFMRVGASATMDGDKWVISGGSTEESNFTTTSEEFEDEDFVLSSFELPIAATNHAFLSLDPDVFFMVGGFVSEEEDDLSNTWIYNAPGAEDVWSPLISTGFPHETVMAGVVTTLDGVKEVVVTGGVPYITEIFSFEQLVWRPGPEFPGHVVEGAYVQYANTFVTVGGVDLDGGDEAYGDTIYLYDADNQVWVHFAQTLETGRTNAVAFLVPDEYCPGGHEP